jgi:hypothetical protein
LTSSYDLARLREEVSSKQHIIATCPIGLLAIAAAKWITGGIFPSILSPIHNSGSSICIKTGPWQMQMLDPEL